MLIYIDQYFKCHINNDGTMTPVNTDFFNGKCDAYIEGYRFVPSGCTWTRSDGEVFHGEMIAPWKDWHDLDDAQRQYEREQLEAVMLENDALLSDLAAMVDVVYESDLEVINNV